MAVNNFQVGGGGSWNSTASWSLGIIPTSNDGHVATFNAASPACNVDVAAVCNSIEFTNYANTITMTNSITSSGNVILGAGMTILGSGSLIVNITCNLTSNGKTWGNPFVFAGSNQTYTLADNWTVGNLTFSTSTAGVIVNGNTLNITGSLAYGTHRQTGTTLLVMTGTGTISGGGSIALALTINTAGTTTYSGTVNKGAGTFTYIAGTSVVTGSTLSIGEACTLAIAGITWNNISFSNIGTTVTFTQNLTCTGNLTQANTLVIAGTPTITVGGNLTFDAITGSGSVWIMNGTGTYRGGNPGGSSITINTAGTVTFSTAQTNSVGNFTHISGSVITTNTTTNISGVYNGGSVTWNHVNITSVNTVTLSSDLNIGGNLLYGSLGQATTINGAFNVNISGNLTMGGTSSITSGTATIRLVGSGTINSTQTVLGLQNNLVIASTNYTLVALRYSTGTITNTSAQVFSSGTLTLANSCTMNNSVSWFNITVLTGTITINQLLTATGTMAVGASGTVTFAGTHGFIVNTLSCTTAGRTINYAAGKNYTITNSLVSTGAIGNRISFVSTASGTGAIFTLQNGASQNVTSTNGTWMDSSGGQTVLTSSDSVLSNTINWSFQSSSNFFLLL